MTAEHSLKHPTVDGQDHELTAATLKTLSLAGLVAGWGWLFVATSLAPNATTVLAQTKTIVPPLLLLVSSAVCLLPSRLPPRQRSGLLLAGLAATFLLSFLWSSPAMLYYQALAVIMAGLLIGAQASLLVALALTLELVWLQRAGGAPRPLSPFLLAAGFIWAAALVSWLSSRSTHLALRAALDSQQRATELLVQLRERQGELNRTLEALTEATRRLERTNKELAVARERAEEARALKEHFAANVSHELRTPLNLIVGFSEMMYLEPESYEGVVWTPELLGDIGQLYRASQHLQGLVSDILDLSRIDAARLPMLRELADIRDIISDALQTIAPLLAQRGLAYSATYPESPVMLFVDRTRIRQVMLNLLNNAVRFTDVGEITVTVQQEGDAVVVSVRDTGVGIPANQLDKIFEEFQQVDDSLRRRGGAGLGLSLSRQFVELHGGRMWAESTVGSGSTFHFTVPLPGSVPQTAPLIQSPRPRPAGVNEGPVIVVDPDPSIAAMLSRYLEDRRVLPARDIWEAEALVEEQHPLAIVINEPPDAPPLQWVGAAGECSQRYGVPIVRCSVPSPSWLKRAQGIDDCLSKPVSRDTLRTAFRQHGIKPGTVLVIDDHPGFGSLMRRMLRTEGLARTVLIAHSGGDGIRLARQARPQVVLLDLLLPDLDGFAVLQALRAEEQLAATRIIAVTATSYAEEALRRCGSFFTVSRARGISTGTCVELLNQVLPLVRPDYAGADRAASA